MLLPLRFRFCFFGQMSLLRVGIGLFHSSLSKLISFDMLFAVEWNQAPTNDDSSGLVGIELVVFGAERSAVCTLAAGQRPASRRAARESPHAF